ncbi:MAG TPA: DUF4230 domain-containing protein [Saprospiraceae bacterium]|nr:DUF4230 domain-containing protein [Saprospiraceae bacterium]
MKWKWIFNGVVLIFIALLIFFLWRKASQSSFFQKHEVESSAVLLEKIERVIKLVAVEANISEIYDYKDYYAMDLSPFRKKVLVRVKARVSAGFNMEAVKIELDDDNKTVYIRNFPPAEILSVDHDLDYYDITQGTFNRFSPADYNKINARAKQFIVEKAKDSRILTEAEQQKEEIISMIRFLVEAGGWQLYWDPPTLQD